MEDPRRAAGQPVIRMRIGLHSGPVVVGNIGAPGRVNFTVVGDTVNIAQRFEQLGRRLPTAELAAEALLRSMRVRLHQDSWAAAGETARTYLERYPNAGPSGMIVAHTCAIITKSGVPGGWGMPRILEAAMNSPASQKVTDGASVTR